MNPEREAREHLRRLESMAEHTTTTPEVETQIVEDELDPSLIAPDLSTSDADPDDGVDAADSVVDSQDD